MVGNLCIRSEGPGTRSYEGVHSGVGMTGYIHRLREQPLVVIGINLGYLRPHLSAA